MEGAICWHDHRLQEPLGGRQQKITYSHVAKNPRIDEQMVEFRKECAKWYSQVGADYFFNYDETFWRLLQGVLIAWGRRGRSTTIHGRTDMKAGFTLGVAISAAGELLKLQIVAKGKTTISLRKFGLSRFAGAIFLSTVCGANLANLLEDATIFFFRQSGGPP